MDVAVTLDRFPVVALGGDAGGGCSSNIEELASVNVLFPPGRYLDICNLEVVESGDEARTAKLEEKTGLDTLMLSWGTSNTDRTRSHVMVAEAVLEGLRPSPKLIKLNVKDYPGPTFLGWMGNGDGGGSFRNLREVELENCTQLPPLGQLASLERLAIVGLGEVERVGSEFFGGPSPTFPCLTHLKLQHMRNWSQWVALPCSEGEGRGESKLKELA